MIKISAIIVTYNRLHLLKKNLKCLLDQTYNLHNIFIINNNSTDGTKSYLNGIKNPLIHVINMKKNLNGAGGFSVGTKIAFEHSTSDYFWLMDDDTMPTSTSLSSLVNAVKELSKPFGFLCSNVRWWKNKEPCNIPTVSLQGWSDLAAKSLIKVREATFVSFLIPRYVVKKYGLPIAKAVIWGDDTEYSRRLSSKLPSYFVSHSIVIHDAASDDLSCNNIISESTNNRIMRYKYMYRNRLFVERKHGSWHSFLKWLAVFLIIVIKIPFKARNKRLLRMFYALYGIILGFFFNPKIKYPKN